MTSPERPAHTREITLEEARQDLEAQVSLMQVTEAPGTDGGRLYRHMAQEALSDDAALQVYVDTWNTIVRQQREMDAGF